MKNLPWPRRIGLKHIKRHTLVEDLVLDQWIVPTGTTVTLTQSENFGYVTLPAGTLDQRGFVIPRQVFAY